MKKSTKILIFALMFFCIITIFSTVKAAGIEGTTIVLNPRTWRKLDRLCKWRKKFNRKRYNIENR